MEEKKILENKNNQYRTIKKHIILIILTFLISTTFIIVHFIILKNNNNAFLFFFILAASNSPLYFYIILTEKNQKRKYQYSMGITFILIICFSFSIILFTKTIYYHLFIYFITLCIYHYSEFFSQLFFHFQNILEDEFLIYENKMWVIATLSSFVEYLIETFFFHKYKDIKIFFIIGLIMTIIGQYFRIAALFTGKSNFTHKIQTKKSESHVLVKHGIYSICRHPSYFGFFIWSVGIEVMCFNPLCIIGFTYILFKFFKNRIQNEEEFLIRFFGMEYIKYRKEVGVLIPFINIDKKVEINNLKLYLNMHKNEINNEEIINYLNNN